MSLIDLLADAGLTGRGGAGFPTATKLAAARESGAQVIVNACDGEVGAVKDAWVVASHLPALTHGAELLAGPRAGKVRFAAHRGSATEHRLRAAGLDVLAVPARYVSSEETSLISAAHGRLARPMTKRSPFVRGGSDGRGRRVRPTLVLNAETTWRVAQVEAHGAAWFRSFGTPGEPGPRLVSVHGHVERPGVLETESGVALSSLTAAARPFDPGRSDTLVGGLAGVFLSADETAVATWSGPGMAVYGGALGSGVLEVLDPRACPLDRVARLLAYAAGETAGQCGPCMFGLPTLARELTTLISHPTPHVLQRVSARLDLLPDRGACRFPDGVSRFTRSALRVYADHLGTHEAGRCPLTTGMAHAGRP